MSARSGRRALVTGGAGFIGCNLADRLASDGCEVVVLDALARAGVERNLAWLERKHGAKITPLIADVRDAKPVGAAMEGVDVVFHLAAQVAVTTSLDDPRADFEVNIGGALNVLEAARASARKPPVIFASTNKVYGDLADVELSLQDGAYHPVDPDVRSRGVGEDRPLDFHTPYGCSKGAADQYVLDYARSFGLPTCVLRMSCIYGPHQMGTEDQGWVAHFLISALADRSISIFGDGRQVRDILHVSDAVAAYLAAWDRIEAVGGRAFNLGGGLANAVSLRQVIAEIEHVAGRRARLQFSDWRPGDQRYYVSDVRAAQAVLGLDAPVDWRTGLGQLAAWLASERAEIEPRPARLRAAAL